MDEIKLVNYDVTCRTENCSNANQTVTAPTVASDPYYVCGVCGNQITDTVLTTPLT